MGAVRGVGLIGGDDLPPVGEVWIMGDVMRGGERVDGISHHYLVALWPRAIPDEIQFDGVRLHHPACAHVDVHHGGPHRRHANECGRVQALSARVG